MTTKAKNRKKTTAKKTRSATKTVVKKTAVRRGQGKKSPCTNPQFVGLEALEPKMRRQSGRLSGDLQGVSEIESADSESVAELLEEGKIVEAEAVAGVEAKVP